MKTQTNHNQEKPGKQGRQSRNTDKPDIKKIIGPLPAIRETSSIRDSSIRSMGDVEGDEARPDLSGDSSGARLSLSAAAERIASSLSGGYQEYKE